MTDAHRTRASTAAGRSRGWAGVGSSSPAGGMPRGTAAAPHLSGPAPAPGSAAAGSAATFLLTTGLLFWLGAAVFAVQQDVLVMLPMPFPQLVLASLTVLLLALFGEVAMFRQWAREVDLRVLASLHLVRFVGIYFLVLHARGGLPHAFAVPGGYGDIAVATSALIVLFISPSSPRGRRAWRVWNIFGLVDILLVVASAARLGIQDPASMSALTRLPLGLLPTFVVPIIITSHAVLAVRLRHRASSMSLG